jgi:hypothetical protein
MHPHFTRPLARTIIATTAVFVLFGSGALAGPIEGGGATPAPPATGTASGASTEVATTGARRTNSIDTAGGNYDPTVLTKFISARGFTANQGAPGGVDADLVEFNGQTCVAPNAASGGSITSLFTAVELPDGARIKQIRLYADDASAGADITATLYRQQFTLAPPAAPARAEIAVAAVSTTGSAGPQVVASADNLNEATGSTSPVAGTTTDRFYDLNVVLTNTQPHVFCGIEVDFQVSSATGDAGTVFHAITPVRAFDSRIAAYTASGVLAPNTAKVIDVSSAHDLTTGALTVANTVPAGATAITYNITVVGATGGGNFVAVTAGDAGSYAAGAINLLPTGAVANASTVGIAADRTIKLWGGTGPGSTQVIIDVTGYYTAPANMAG